MLGEVLGKTLLNQRQIFGTVSTLVQLSSRVLTVTNLVLRPRSVVWILRQRVADSPSLVTLFSMLLQKRCLFAVVHLKLRSRRPIVFTLCAARTKSTGNRVADVDWVRYRILKL